MDFPRMLYRPGTAAEIWGRKVDKLIVTDERQLDAALADGWGKAPDHEPPKPREPKKAAPKPRKRKSK